MERSDAWRRSEGDINTSPERLKWLKSLDAKTRDVLARDADRFVHQSLSSPCLNVAARAQGATLFTPDGGEVYDFHGNNVHQLGYGHPDVIQAVTEMLHTLPFSPRRYTNEPAVQLAERLVGLTGGKMAKVLYAPAATLAVDTAIKLARIATGKPRLVSLWEAFHGASLGALSVGGQAQFRSGLGTLGPETSHIPPSAPSNCPWRCGNRCDLRCADYLEYVLDATQDVAGFILEPIRNTDVTIPPQGYFDRIQAICRRHGVLLILDETATGLGRTGTMFAYQQFGLDPDMVILGKGLGGGVFPMAALLVRKELDVVPSHSIGHYTHEKSPVGARAALAVIDVIERDGLCARATAIGTILRRHLNQINDHLDVFAEVRQIGALAGAQLQDSPAVPGNPTAEQVMYAAFARGVSFKVSAGSTLTLSPPLIISDAQLTDAMERIRDSVESVWKNAAKEPKCR